jgi:hypothetical protein
VGSPTKYEQDREKLLKRFNYLAKDSTDAEIDSYLNCMNSVAYMYLDACEQTTIIDFQNEYRKKMVDEYCKKESENRG